MPTPPIHSTHFEVVWQATCYKRNSGHDWKVSEKKQWTLVLSSLHSTEATEPGFSLLELKFTKTIPRFQEGCVTSDVKYFAIAASFVNGSPVSFILQWKIFSFWNCDFPSHPRKSLTSSSVCRKRAVSFQKEVSCCIFWRTALSATHYASRWSRVVACVVLIIIVDPGLPPRAQLRGLDVDKRPYDRLC